jgi:hypothetical protein
MIDELAGVEARPTHFWCAGLGYRPPAGCNTTACGPGRRRFAVTNASLREVVARDEPGFLQGVQDALDVSCGAFLTMERRLPTQAPFIERATGLRVMRPTTYWLLLSPRAAFY